MPHRLAEVVIVPTAVDAWSHHITCHRAVGIEAILCQAFTDDVAVSHHSDQPVVLANRNGAYIMLRINFASSVIGVSGLTQSTPLCIAFLTFIVGTSVSDLDTSMRCSVNPQPLTSILQQVGALARGVLCASAHSVESRHSSSAASSESRLRRLPFGLHDWRTWISSPWIAIAIWHSRSISVDMVK